MKLPYWIALFFILIFLGGVYSNGQSDKQEVFKWKIHDPDRPQPPVVDPDRRKRTTGPLEGRKRLYGGS